MARPRLLPHQRRVINYMLRVQPNQFGLLVAHYMGTGKTITALAFLQNCARGARVIIVHPHGLRSIWRADSKTLGIDSENYTYLSYPEFFRAFAENPNILTKDTVMIFDEAHILAQTFELSEPTVAMHLFKSIVSTHRALLLTGTPIYNSELELRWLVNIAAGHPILPLVEQEYRRLYHRRSIVAGIVHTWVLPFFQKGVPIIMSIEFANFARKMVSSAMHALKHYSADQLKKLYSDVAQHNIGPTSGMFAKMFFKPASQMELDTMAEKIFTKEFADKMTGQLKFILTGMFAFVIVFVVMTVIVWIAKTYFEPENFDYLDTNKLMEACGKFVSMYELESTTKSKEAPFPATRQRNRPVSYTNSQMAVWIALTWRIAPIQDLEKILPKSVMQTDSNIMRNLIGGRYVSSKEAWIKYARVIGNLEINNETPNKFNAIYEDMKMVGLKRAVIYSSFWDEGGLQFAEFLKKRKLAYAFIIPSMHADDINAILRNFEHGKLPVIILHPSMTEGLSIKGARQMHILEPLLSYAKHQQLVARVVRYESHASLPLGERHVDINIWYASVNGVFQYLRRHATSITQWFTGHAHVNYLRRALEFSQDVTPDYMALKEMEKLQNVVDALKKYKNGKHIANSRVPADESNSRLSKCCIWEPDPEMVEMCLRNRGAKCVV